jgi:predicted MPP superfamily phosphohydrolase
MGRAVPMEGRSVKFWLMVVLFWLMLAGVSSGQDNGFYFVQISDTHLGIPGNRERTEQVVAAVNRLPMEIACVVHTGDIIDRRKQGAETLADAALIFKKLKPAVHFLPGNHDINLMAFTQKSRADYERYFGSLISRAEYKGVVFLFAYTDPLRESIVMDGYDPLGVIKEQLDATHGKPVILFHHGPSVENFYNNRFHGGWAKEAKENWVTLINQYNIKAVITGHFHRDEFHWLGEVPLYVSPPVAQKWGRQACFRIYEYQQNGLGYTTQYLE